MGLLAYGLWPIWFEWKVLVFFFVIKNSCEHTWICSSGITIRVLSNRRPYLNQNSCSNCGVVHIFNFSTWETETDCFLWVWGHQMLHCRIFSKTKHIIVTQLTSEIYFSNKTLKGVLMRNLASLSTLVQDKWAAISILPNLWAFHNTI